VSEAAASPRGAGVAPPRHSPFEGRAPFEHPTRAGTIGVRLEATTVAGATLVGTWPGAAAALCDALGAALGIAVPGHTGATAQAADGLLMRIGPEEFLLVSEQPLDMPGRLRARIRPDVGSVTDLGHARCRIRIEGEHSCDTLSKLFALDLRAPAFPVAQARLSGHHHVASLLHRLAPDAFDLYVSSTYAFDQLATLADAAREYGVALRPPAPWSAATHGPHPHIAGVNLSGGKC